MKSFYQKPFSGKSNYFTCCCNMLFSVDIFFSPTSFTSLVFQVKSVTVKKGWNPADMTTTSQTYLTLAEPLETLGRGVEDKLHT